MKTSKIRAKVQKDFFDQGFYKRPEVSQKSEKTVHSKINNASKTFFLRKLSTSESEGLTKSKK